MFVFVGVSFENCLVEISFQRVCGRHVASNFFLVEVSVEICLVRISLQSFSKNNAFEDTLQ